MITFAVIIPAAGSGSRSGQEIPKQYVDLLGIPVLAHALQAFAQVEGCTEIIVAIDTAWRTTAELCAAGLENVRFIEGGAERQHSIANALAILDGAPDLVLVHDAARPCVSPELIRRVINTAHLHGAAIPVLPINETVKRVNDQGIILETIPRAQLRAAQTPQGFQRQLLHAAYDHAALHGILGTDDASLVESYGAQVYAVEGDPENIKITLPGDFERAGRESQKSKVKSQK